MELNEYWSAHAVEEYKGMLYEQKVQNYTYNCERSAPHIIHNAKIFKDGNKYCCLLRNALKGYKRLNRKALEQIKPNSILFTFSCSQVINKDQFRLAVFSAAAEAKRNVRILHQLTQSADHPINIYHPEGEYLKGLVLFVE